MSPPELCVTDCAAWRAWLDEHHGETDGVWLVLARKGATSPTSLTYDEALEEALTRGWIDGQLRSRDDQSFLRRFTPRRRRSIWSARNVEIVGRLTEAGRMHPGGLAEVEAARRDGRWERAYQGSATIEVPADLTAALAEHPSAAEAFAALTRSARYPHLHAITTAATPETRARRIEKLLRELS